MRLIAKKLTFALLVIMLAVPISGCNPSEYEATEPQIISAVEFSEIIAADENVVIVDMQKAEDFEKGHVEGAINIVAADILINVPVDNMLTSKAKFERAMSESGISNDSKVLIYDNNKMSAARLWWTFLMYGNENAKVVDGGLNAIADAGVQMTTNDKEVEKTSYVAGDKSTAYIANLKDVQNQINEPNPNVVLLDVRSDEEYAEKGKIPSSCMMDYNNIFYSDGTFKDIQTTRINFIDNDMRPEQEIIIYCQTSMRAAPVFLTLYNAGYRNIKIYDGAYLEWSSNPNNPIELPAGASLLPGKKDAS